MPIEIKEMHIKINVSEKPTSDKTESSSSGDMLIQECMDQMTKLLNDKEER